MKSSACSNRSRLWSLSLVLFVLSICCGAAFALSDGESLSDEEPLSDGEWVESRTGGGCPEGTLCAEWQIDGVSQMTCCVEPQYIGTSLLGACSSGRP